MSKNKVSVFPVGKDNVDYSQYFSGKSWLADLNSEEISLVNVTFEPGCRNNWHIHHGVGQLLICVGGTGWYQEFGAEARFLKPGDVVYIAPEIKHWHGASSDSYFSHLAAYTPKENASNEWLEKVNDQEYEMLSENDYKDGLFTTR